MDIKDIVICAVSSVLKDAIVTKETVIRGNDSTIDSLGFIRLIVDIERRIKETIGVSVNIFKPEYFLGKSENPYKTVGSLIALIRGLCGDVEKPVERKPKIIFTDLDGTLWDGIAGEDVKITANDVFVELYRLYQHGILLVIVTKNYESNVSKLFSGANWGNLDLSDFVVCKYNVVDKAATIRDVCADLNLALDSAVFLDDSEHERDRVKTALPMVWVPENHMDIAKIETGVITEEDRNRTAMYKQEYERVKSKPHSDSMDDYMAWLAGLDMVLTVKSAETKEEIDRAKELIDRSNQFNFSKKLPDGPYITYVFNLKDRFGDSGIIAVANFGNRVFHNLCVSCRVLGRGVENAIYKFITDYGYNVMPPVDSGKNKAAIDFWNVHRNSATIYPIKVVNEV